MSSSSGEIADASSSSSTEASSTGDSTGDGDPIGPHGDPGPDLRVYYELHTQPDAPVLERIDLVDGAPTQQVQLEPPAVWPIEIPLGCSLRGP